jgi:N,N-dimethylformamidase
MKTSVAVIGYADQMSVRAGQEITFYISSVDTDLHAQIVRVHRNLKDFDVIESIPQGAVRGCLQKLRAGSSARLAAPAELWPGDLSVRLWVLATTVRDDRQGIATFGPDGGLFLDAGRIVFRWGGAEITIDEPVDQNVWYEVAFDLPGDDRPMKLSVVPEGRQERYASAMRNAPEVAVTPGMFRLSGWTTGRGVTGCFDGKLSGVTITSRSRGLVASWRFESYINRQIVPDASGSGHDIILEQNPRRGVTGPQWDGSSQHPRECPAHYDAIAFHTDDLTDAGWAPSLVWTVPADLRSGAYALEVSGASGRDHIPFIVTPSTKRPRPRAVFLVPTFSYLAYANERHWWDMPDVVERLGVEAERAVTAAEVWARDMSLLSCYDRHRDGSGCTHSSWKRPIVNFRADYHHPYVQCPHQFSADILILDWLDQCGVDVDLITDHDLHEAGAKLLDPYTVLLTGSHPEYASVEVLDSLERFNESGGNIIYLGGNGFMIAVSTYQDGPHVMELRRGHSGGSHWKSPPGEAFHAATGELGGKWALRNRSPHRLFGVGTAGVSFERGSPYVRQPSSYTPDLDWIFDGVRDGIIDTPSVILGQPAGFEYDHTSAALGTPKEAVRLATARFDPADTEHTVEENRWTGRPVENRCDLVYVPPINGRGAVFSVGSIAWSGCLLFDGTNKVAIITSNVLRRFLTGSGGVGQG